MSILISGVGLPFPFSEEEALAAARKKLSLSSGAVRSGRVHKQSLDLRRGELKAVCTVELELCGDERAFAERCLSPPVKNAFPRRRWWWASALRGCLRR